MAFDLPYVFVYPSPGLPTFGDMQARIADELDRSDLTVQIKRAIVSAVRHYARRRFWFTESSFTFSTVAGQRVYSEADAPEIAATPSIEVINGDFFNTRIPLHKQSFKYVDRKTSQTLSRGQPEDWAYYSRQIWLYPVPDRAYTLTAFHIPTLTELSNDTDSNAWTSDAEELIRTHAKIDLMRNVIRGPEMGEEIAELGLQEKQALDALISESGTRKAVGFATPTQF